MADDRRRAIVRKHGFPPPRHTFIQPAARSGRHAEPALNTLADESAAAAERIQRRDRYFRSVLLSRFVVKRVFGDRIP
jgi:hypothetical protein